MAVRRPLNPKPIDHVRVDRQRRVYRDMLVSGHVRTVMTSWAARPIRRRRRARSRPPKPRLRISQILAWADAHHRRTGMWPNHKSGPIVDAPGYSWLFVQNALIHGFRGLPGDSSLARLLSRHRGVRNRKGLPHFKVSRILRWADAHHRRTGRWPTKDDGPIVDLPGETWGAVEQAMRKGLRGLPRGNSLSRLLYAHRKAGRAPNGEPLTAREILTWADAHHRRTGTWPTPASDKIPDRPGETWNRVHRALSRGSRGMPGGDSLLRFLARHRGVRNRTELPPLREREILAWADAHQRRMGHWPTADSGAIAATNGETWSGVNNALYRGHRGLPGGSSLFRFLAEHRAIRKRPRVPVKPHLSIEQILAWADAFKQRTGCWPRRESGRVTGGTGTTWTAVDLALKRGLRGLPAGGSLSRLLIAKRGASNGGARARPISKIGSRRVKVR